MGRPVELFHGFVGQGRNVRQLRRYADNAKAEGVPFPHTLFSGAPGSGKTELAKSLAGYIGTGFQKICASPELTRLRLAEYVKHWKPHDVVALDEIQSIPIETQEMFCRVMLEHTILCIDLTGTKPRLCTEEETAPEVTIIGCTDQAHNLLKSLRSRFPLVIPFDPYTLRELKTLIEQFASHEQMLLSPQAAKILAATCRGNPRLANDRVRLLRLYFTRKDNQEFTAKMVRKFLNANGIDISGLTREERRHLEFLNKHDGHPVSLGTIASGIDCNEGHVISQVEPWLKHEGFINTVHGGRVLTKKGKDLFNKKEENNHGNR